MRPRNGFTLIETLAVIAIVGILLGLMVPAVQKVRAAAARTTCANNLRQIALALHQYHDVRHAFPPGVTNLRTGWSEDRFDLLSWRPRIMPFMEQQPYWDRTVRDYRQNPTPTWTPYHSLTGQVVAVFGCPMDDRVFQSQKYPVCDFDIALSSYCGINGSDLTKRDGVFYENSRTRLTDIRDGASQTLLVGERPPSNDFRYGWLYFGTGQRAGSCDHTLGVREIALPITGCPPGPYHFKEDRLGIPCGFMHYWSPHTGGGHFAYGDASVHFLSYSADPIMPALATRSGGEVVDLP